MLKVQEQVPKKFRSRFFLFKPPRTRRDIAYSLYDADFVGNVQRIVVGGETHIRLLLAVGADQGVHLGHVDVVQLLHRRLDLMLVSLEEGTILTTKNYRNYEILFMKIL